MSSTSNVTTVFFVNRVIDTAASQLTKTAITVTAIFIVALGYDLWYYILGHLGVTEYIYNSPKQKYGKYLSKDTWLVQKILILIFFFIAKMVPCWIQNITLRNVSATS